MFDVFKPSSILSNPIASGVPGKQKRSHGHPVSDERFGNGLVDIHSGFGGTSLKKFGEDPGR